jgi:hypothetical protein
MVNAAVVQGRIMFLPGEICPTLRPPPVVALHVVMHEVIGQKTENCSCIFCIHAIHGNISRRHSSGFILMKRRPEAKEESLPLCSISQFGLTSSRKS